MACEDAADLRQYTPTHWVAVALLVDAAPSVVHVSRAYNSPVCVSAKLAPLDIAMDDTTTPWLCE